MKAFEKSVVQIVDNRENFPPFFFLFSISNGRRSLCEIIAVSQGKLSFPNRKEENSVCLKVKEKRFLRLCSQLGSETSQDELSNAGNRFLHIVDFESRHPI